MTDRDDADRALEVRTLTRADGRTAVSARLAASGGGTVFDVAVSEPSPEAAESALGAAAHAAVDEIAGAVATQWPRRRARAVLPAEPPEALLLSIAMRHDHAIGMGAELYDAQVGREPGDHARNLAALLADARRAYDEVRDFDFDATRD